MIKLIKRRDGIDGQFYMLIMFIFVDWHSLAFSELRSVSDDKLVPLNPF